MMGKTARFKLYSYNTEIWTVKNNIWSNWQPVT
jgi:hypothetical protein